jgi:hypothetical protein
MLTCLYYAEFKEIRKEWKAKKKEEDAARKQEEERHRQEAQRQGQDGAPPQGQPAQYGQAHMLPPQMGGPQLPPIGYQATGGQPAGQYTQPQQVDGAPQYAYAQAYPGSPYAQGGMQYQQRMYSHSTARAGFADAETDPEQAPSQAYQPQ